MDAELTALASLVQASEGRATPEAVVALGIAVASPWSGDRRDIRDQPPKSAQGNADALLRFMRDVRSGLAAPLSQEHGWLAWLRYSGLAKPLGAISTGPAWIRSGELADGWVALPPRGGLDGTEAISQDGRIAALHILCSQIAPGSVPLAAALSVLEWLAGPRAADWSHCAAEQCPSAMTFPQVRYRAWHATFRNLRPAHLLPAITGRPVISPSWMRPAPTAAELAALRNAEMVREATAQNAAAWRRPKRTASA